MQTASNGTKQTPWPNGRPGLTRFVTVAVASLVVGVAAAWILGLAWLSARATVAAPGPASAHELLALGAASLALVIAGWLVVGTALEVLSHVPGFIGASARVWSKRLTPALARRIAAVILGVGVGVAGGPTQAVAGPRSASVASSVAAPGVLPTDSSSSTPVPDPGFAPSPIASGLTPTAHQHVGSAEPPAPGFTPTAPRVRPQVDPRLLGGRAPAGSAITRTSTSEVVVHRGDSLWSIAARHLGPHASDAEIAHAWPQWFELNRDVIGDDPDLILPGQILRTPAPERGARVFR